MWRGTWPTRVSNFPPPLGMFIQVVLVPAQTPRNEGFGVRPSRMEIPLRAYGTQSPQALAIRSAQPRFTPVLPMMTTVTLQIAIWKAATLKGCPKWWPWGNWQKPGLSQNIWRHMVSKLKPEAIWLSASFAFRVPLVTHKMWLRNISFSGCGEDTRSNIWKALAHSRAIHSSLASVSAHQAKIVSPWWLSSHTITLWSVWL
jgi:hypothetical protein